MRLRLLETKVARRILTLFLLCAALPVGALAALAYTRVASHLTEQSWVRLGNTSKNLAMAVMERLELLDEELGRAGIDGRIGEPAGRVGGPGVREVGDPARRAMFRRLGVWADGAAAESAGGAAIGRLSAAERDRLAEGRPLLVIRAADPDPPRIFLLRASGAGDEGRWIWGEVEPSYLWASRVALPPSLDVCVAAEAGPLHGCSEAALGTLARARRPESQSAVGRLSWAAADGERLGAHWPLFLRSAYGASPWTFLLSEPKAAVLAPAASFRRTFPLVVLLCLLVVILFSEIQISRSLDPVAELREGTSRVARGEFDVEVDVTTGDELEELGRSFNGMVRQLGRQFQALVTTGEIDRAILGALDAREIVRTVLRRAPDLVRASDVWVALGSDRAGTLYWLGPGGRLEERRVWLAADGRPTAPVEPDASCGREEGVDPFEARHLLVQPVHVEGEVGGSVIFARAAPPEFDEEDRRHIRLLADQIAVAVTNAKLVDDLEQMNLGTVRALASAIDAKSRWTAGHSDRVTEVALMVGRRLELDASELELLRRGGLLHDVGKIGVPAHVLDKPGPLDPDEMRIMRDHVHHGARIVEPIPQYAPIIPVILQHHERHDGSGYPYGLTGEGIHLLARIVGVADSWDAMTSDRPYRAGLPAEEAIEEIRRQSGRGFDPTIVEAFLRAVPEILGSARPAGGRKKEGLAV